MKLKSRSIFFLGALGLLAATGTYFCRQIDTKEASKTSSPSLSTPPKGELVMKTLRIDGKILDPSVSMSGPCWVEIQLTNKSPQPVRINRRLAVGYRHSQARELFLEVFKKDSAEVVSKQALLYERDFSPPDDYVWLAPEQSVSTSFDLFKWYSLPSPGEYELMVYYQADEPLAAKPADLLTGTHSSERVAFRVVN
jgi:hypothetical protein